MFSKPIKEILLTLETPISTRVVKSRFKKIAEVEMIAAGDDNLHVIVTLKNAKGKSQEMILIV